ncbi:hypothetical protein WJX81_001704 [Elliptochloris bilobata]|uniref:Uncharacterized protein n=1 Tax=Elliptochloris bilobata TaxID=381761 RepID=A0AAW1S9E9_9CHLO
MQIAPEAAATFLQRQKTDAETYAKDLASTLAELNGLSEAEAMCLLSTEGERAVKSLSHQLASWRAFMRGDADLTDCEREATSKDRARLTNETDRRETVLNKLAAMGGRPALGGTAAGDGGAEAAEEAHASAPVNTPLAALRPDATTTPANTPASAAGPWMKDLKERKARAMGSTLASGSPRLPQGVSPSELQAALLRRGGGVA